MDHAQLIERADHLRAERGQRIRTPDVGGTDGTAAVSRAVLEKLGS